MYFDKHINDVASVVLVKGRQALVLQIIVHSSERVCKSGQQLFSYIFVVCACLIRCIQNNSKANIQIFVNYF